MLVEHACMPVEEDSVWTALSSKYAQRRRRCPREYDLSSRTIRR